MPHSAARYFDRNAKEPLGASGRAHITLECPACGESLDGGHRYLTGVACCTRCYEFDTCRSLDFSSLGDEHTLYAPSNAQDAANRIAREIDGLEPGVLSDQALARAAIDGVLSEER